MIWFEYYVKFWVTTYISTWHEYICDWELIHIWWWLVQSKGGCSGCHYEGYGSSQMYRVEIRLNVKSCVEFDLDWLRSRFRNGGYKQNSLHSFPHKYSESWLFSPFPYKHGRGWRLTCGYNWVTIQYVAWYISKLGFIP